MDYHTKPIAEVAILFLPTFCNTVFIDAFVIPSKKLIAILTKYVFFNTGCGKNYGLYVGINKMNFHIQMAGFFSWYTPANVICFSYSLSLICFATDTS